MLSKRVVKVGQHRGNPRLWLEGKWLIPTGFTWGQLYTIVERDNGVTLKLDPSGDLKVSGKRKGEDYIPVIDINSPRVSKLSSSVEVTAHEGRIVISNREE